ncbi:hypothetical protein G3N95_14755 [Paraburkholderia sp. Tr-20389]|uniref:hypothetical protein n=1 Tax=Paraburkholderia sp. Tr-20389 TaxID=2703903 RepID=UPI00197DEDDC|nr:hypothetical protein [Paraburkholderia sp. Tr-20389]MBN3754209.1 hypothetical protein [Paraburkholderia sp. Tr-20389]
MKRIALLTLVPALLAACAPVDAVRKESSLTWATVTIASSPAALMRSAQERTRRCGFLVGSVTMDGSYFPDTADQALDLTVHMAGGGAVGFGRLRMATDGTSTAVRIGTPDSSFARDVGARVGRVLADPSLACDA